MGNLVDDILLLSALREVAATFFIETSDDLLQSIHGVVPHGMPYSLFRWRYKTI